MNEREATPLTQAQVAVLLGLSRRRLSQLDAEGAGPPRDPDASYPIAELGVWLRRNVTDPDRARLKKAQASLAELDLREREGGLHATAQVEAHWSGMVLSFRSRALNLPHVAAPLVAGKSMPEAQATLQGLVNEMLEELASNGVPS